MGMRRVSSWIEARSIPFMVTMFLAVAGAAYSLFWSELARHGWQSYSDLWNSAGLALSVGHGHWTAIYAPSSQLDAPPGFEYLLAPAMVVGHGLGLGTTLAAGSGFKAFGLILAAVATVMGGSVLFALDAVARYWDYTDAERLALSALAGLGVVSAAAFWGHPEDCLALAFVLWAALAVERRGTNGLARAGWLLGIAVACQPLALLAVTPVVARFGWRGVRVAAWRLALPAAVLLVPELVTSTARTLHAVVYQPYFPAAESSTPFSHLARYLGHGMYSGGTLRVVATIIALVLGWVACRRRHDLPTVLFVMALAFTLRVVFESELLGFYFYPVVAICLLLTMRESWSRFELCAVLSVIALVLGNRRQHAITLWWPAIMLTTVAMVALAYAAAAEGDVHPVQVPHLRRREGDEPVITISHVRLLRS
jgi:hypothetical protein